MVTLEHQKVRTTGEDYRNYISYFQSVATIGIINRAKTAKEAELKARIKLRNSDLMCGVVGQTPFELHATDEWVPSLEACNEFVSSDNPNNPTNPIPPTNDPIILNLDDNTKRCIADKINKDVSALTKEDCSTFVKWCIEHGLA